MTSKYGQLGIIEPPDGNISKAYVGSPCFTKIFTLTDGPLKSVHFLNDHTLVVSGVMRQGLQKVFLIDLQNNLI